MAKFFPQKDDIRLGCYVKFPGFAGLCGKDGGELVAGGRFRLPVAGFRFPVAGCRVDEGR